MLFVLTMGFLIFLFQNLNENIYAKVCREKDKKFRKRKWTFKISGTGVETGKAGFQKTSE